MREAVGGEREHEHADGAWLSSEIRFAHCGDRRKFHELAGLREETSESVRNSPVLRPGGTAPRVAPVQGLGLA